MNKKLRKMKVAGQFYPNNSDSIQQLINETYNSIEISNKKVKSVIVPHAGYIYSGKTAIKTLLEASKQNYENIFIIAPSHYVRFNGLALCDFESMDTPFGALKVNKTIVEELKASGHHIINEPHIHEHSLEVQLPLIKSIFPDCKVVPIICGVTDNSDKEKAAEALVDYWMDDKNLWIISSDFTHYGSNFNYIPFTKNIKENLNALDSASIKHIKNLSYKEFNDFVNKTGVTICGRGPISIMLKLAEMSSEKLHLKSKLIEYTTSGEISGDFSHCVSYVGIIFYCDEENNLSQVDELSVQKTNTGKDMKENPYYSQENQKLMLSLARKTIESKLNNQNFELKKIPDFLTPTGSCFVTLHSPNGNLRGCIGNIEAFENLYDNIRHNASNSAFSDPRFPKLASLDELSSLRIEISVLTPKEKVKSYKDIILGKHGIILKALGRGAVFLPQVAPEQGWDLPTTLTHLSMKAGLSHDAWKKDYTKYEVFSAIVFSE